MISQWIEQLRDSDNSQYLIYLLMLLLFAADSQTQLGFAHGFLYAPLLLLASLTNKLRLLNFCFYSAILLIILGILISPAAPQGFAFGYVLANRIGACICLLLIYLQMRAAIVLQMQQARQQVNMLRQQQQMQLINQLTHFGRWTFDPHNHKLSLSAEAKALLPASSRNRLTISQFSALFHSPYQLALQQLLSDCIDLQQAFDIDCAYRLEDNKTHWLRIVGYPASDIGNGMQGIVQDVNSAHQISMRLAQQQQQFKQWADSMPIMVWTADSGGNLTLVNQTVTTFTGKAEKELLHDWLDIVHPDERDAVMAHWQHCVQSGDAYSIEFRMRRLDGNYVWHLVKAVAVNDTDGKVEKWLGSAMALGAANKAAPVPPYNTASG
ncbi:MAG: PAS domain-containing protein [Gammaproteobacteria bacterium]|nr:PAS domain-containing protein [Gammaproteobacteria bacterium]MBU1554920.1 PAS domain-containing protein [Gammaproteobacteria bacterium]MBU2069077.1 PAS domain-containing protein [Gammaproteobacteria bacterium]MBU2182668.1 PAS domain-containing protein [Gammaproteobacteria bacterium]MBU2206595.1 PAS domain-containing protein [Gammaproteobacteria bacterium]